LLFERGGDIRTSAHNILCIEVVILKRIVEIHTESRYLLLWPILPR
jgi:hypothetical protein